jgi:hypothetical protein
VIERDSRSLGGDVTAPDVPPRDVPNSPRARRLRSPLLWALWLLLAFEAAGGLVLFFARLAYGESPGEAPHVIGGLLFTLVYAIYQIQHWHRVAPWRARVDYALGLIAAVSLIATNATGIVLGLSWWRAQPPGAHVASIAYAPTFSAVHNIASMLALTFTLAHLSAVLKRDRRRIET